MSSETLESEQMKSAMKVSYYISKFPISIVFMTGLTAFMAWYYTVPVADVAFSILFSLYLFLANAFRFQFNALARGDKKPKDMVLLKEDNKEWFTVYVRIFGVVGVVLPVVTLFFGPENVVQAVAPHLFLAMSQAIAESIVCLSPKYHDLIRVLVPIGFSAYRMKRHIEWVDVAWNSSQGGGFWYHFGFGLAVTNLIVWSYNLLVFLLLRMTPPYLDPVDSPAAPVEWKGQLVPILTSSTRNQEKKDS